MKWSYLIFKWLFNNLVPSWSTNQDQRNLKPILQAAGGINYKWKKKEKKWVYECITLSPTIFAIR